MVEYGYDAASRVTGITYKQNGTIVLGDLTYEYDKNGNRTKIGGSYARTGIPKSVSTTNYNGGNQQTTFGDKTLTYDDNGNLTSITDSNGTTLYNWNPRNQLIGISGPNVNASFVYDGMGRRQKKTINGSLTEFLYDGVNPVQESSASNILANILSGLRVDEFLTRTDIIAGVTSNFLTDALGSPVVMTDNAGAVQTEYTYESFGRTTATGASNSNSYQYTGREKDGTDLYYYRARYYHPELQRFSSEDPQEFHSGDINLFAYVFNSPTNVVDPSGLQAAAIPTPFGPLPPIGVPSKPINPSQVIPGIGRALDDLLDDLGDDLEDLLDRMTAPGRQADSGVEEMYRRYVEQEKACRRTPDDRCTWLANNRANITYTAWRRTVKAWKCRPSRANR